MNDNLTRLDPEKYQHLLNGLLSRPHELSTDWLRSHQWAAVPVPDVINDMDAEWISEAARRTGIKECIAITTEPKMIPECFRIPMTQPGLHQFQSNLHLRYFLLTPKGREFVILHEANYFFIIAAPRDFVRAAVGCSLSTARTMFRERYAEDKTWPPPRPWPPETRQLLLATADRYEPFDGGPNQDKEDAADCFGETSEVISETLIRLDHEKYRHLSNGLLSSPFELSTDWLRRQQWAAVPVPVPINDMDAEWISKAARRMGIQECVAITTESDIMPECVKIPMSQPGILQFWIAYFSKNFLLAPRDREFVILHEANEFFIVAGPRDFVRSAVGCSLPTARMMFLEWYAEYEDRLPERRQLLLATANRYEPFDGVE
ncbi:MAG: hypothetical protein GY854_19645 [Deltaproteobacteria bacterium]|nr:hypothetical protein [Deltaproteobacteria bacterium]